MKHRLKPTLATLLIAATVLAVAPFAAARDSDWTVLGELHVRDRTDKDTLHVGIKKGTFDAVRFQVEGRAVQFHDMKIHFENGDVQDVPLRTVIRAGHFSRIIDLDGGQRAIEKIVFVYDAQTRRRGKGARVEVFGRH
ncbi:MAG: DUF2541 family protein [Acidobacteria bacterium]|nr:DUF2541 family protein [Acidobacteriota bacterium]